MIGPGGGRAGFSDAFLDRAPPQNCRGVVKEKAGMHAPCRRRLRQVGLLGSPSRSGARIAEAASKCRGRVGSIF